MTAHELATRLEARPSGRGSWRARCPAHESRRSLSLAIAAGDDGRVLLHCHAGCEAEEVVASIGLELRDLMPEDTPRPTRRRESPMQILERECPRLAELAGAIRKRDREIARLADSAERMGEMGLAAAIRWRAQT